MRDICTKKNESEMKVHSTVVGHGQNGNLCNRSVTALYTTGAFVNGRQIGVHVTRETTTTRYLYASNEMCIHLCLLLC
jgi:hypothetical protein